MLIAPRPSAHKKEFNGRDNMQGLANCKFKDALHHHLVSSAMHQAHCREEKLVREQTMFGKPFEGASMQVTVYIHHFLSTANYSPFAPIRMLYRVFFLTGTPLKS